MNAFLTKCTSWWAASSLVKCKLKRLISFLTLKLSPLTCCLTTVGSANGWTTQWACLWALLFCPLITRGRRWRGPGEGRVDELRSTRDTCRQIHRHGSTGMKYEQDRGQSPGSPAPLKLYVLEERIAGPLATTCQLCYRSEQTRSKSVYWKYQPSTEERGLELINHPLLKKNQVWSCKTHFRL